MTETAMGQGSEEDDDWHVPAREEQEPERFDIEAVYTPAEFLRILRTQIAAALEQAPAESASYIAVLEHWEKRAQDLAGEAGELANDCLIGFVVGIDEVVRMRLMLDGGKTV